MAERVSPAGTPPAINTRHELAELGSAAAESAERRQYEAAYGPKPDSPETGQGKLTSDAETGFVYCNQHGICKCVNPETGEWDRAGICEWCYRQDWDPDRLERRTKEAAVKKNAEALERKAREQAARRVAKERAAREEMERRAALQDAVPSEPAVGESAGEAAGRDDVDEAAPGVDGPGGVEASPAARGPDDGSDMAGDGEFDAWLRRSGVEPGDQG